MFRDGRQQRRWTAIGLLSMFVLLNCPKGAAKLQPIRTDYNAFFEGLIAMSKVSPLNQAFAGFVLNRDLPQANAQLAVAWKNAMGDHETLTPEVADEEFKWQMRTWVRIYYLFATGHTEAPNRLSSENTKRIEELFWNYAVAKSRVERADVKNRWFIQGSENHDIMDLGNAYLAVQVLAELPDYKVRPLPDGKTPAEHVTAWHSYYTEYCAERFRKGLLIEFASPTYGKYFIPELVNLRDFSLDSTVQGNANALLDLIWSDWAIEQLNGIRGGAKARCYQGKYSQGGARDSWYAMGRLLLKTDGWKDPSPFGHPIMGNGLVLATTGYTLPTVVKELATHPKARGEYAYVSRRPGRMTHIDPQPDHGGQSCWYHFADEDSRLLRYSWCTPDHILGSYTLDPALREDYQIYPAEPGRAEAHYAAITTQNLWQGLIFETGPDARIFPQTLGDPDKGHPEHSTTYVQQVSVQHENVFLTQANRNYPPLTAMRVYFGPGMKARLVEVNGWYILEEGNSYVGVRVFDLNDGEIAGKATWDDDNFLRTADPFAPVALVTGRKNQFPTRADFERYLATHRWVIEEGILTYLFHDKAGTESTLRLNTQEATVPRRNGVAVDFSPEKYYDSPFFHESEDRKSVRLEFGGESHTMTVD